MFITRRRIVADDELDTRVDDVDVTDEVMDDEGGVDVDPEATDLLFETEDVAQLVAEVTGEDVEVTVDDDAGDVSFAVGEDVYTVTPEEDTEILESCKASSKARPKRRVKASTAQRRRKSSVRANTSARRRLSKGTTRVIRRK